jgi:hypothetical protein
MSRKTDAHTLIVLFVLALVAAFCTLSLPAHATGKPEPTPSSPSTSAADAAARAKAGAKAASTSTSSVGDVSQGLSTGDDRSRFLSLAFAPPAFTPPMAPVDGCAAEVRQSADAITLLGSKAAGVTDPSVCHLFTLRNLKVQQCQYATAKRIEDRLIAKMLPDFPAPAELGYVDLSREACAAVHAPPVAPSTPQNLVAAAPVPAASAPEPSRSSAASATELCATAAQEAPKPARQAGQRRAGTAAAAASAPVSSRRCTP